MIQLVALNPSDRSEVRSFVEFVNSCYNGAVPLTDESVSSGRTRLFWALVEGKRVGVTGYVPKTVTLAETVKTVIAPEHRGRGLGAALSQAIEDRVRADGFRKVMTTIYIDNYAMILLKLKQGYRFEGFHPDHEKPGWHEYSFGKVLA